VQLKTILLKEVHVKGQLPLQQGTFLHSSAMLKLEAVSNQLLY